MSPIDTLPLQEKDKTHFHMDELVANRCWVDFVLFFWHVLNMQRWSNVFRHRFDTRRWSKHKVSLQFQEVARAILIPNASGFVCYRCYHFYNTIYCFFLIFIIIDEEDDKNNNKNCNDRLIMLISDDTYNNDNDNKKNVDKPYKHLCFQEW